jgi:hypothetical protein
VQVTDNQFVTNPHPLFHGTQRFIAVFREVAVPPDSLILNKPKNLQTVMHYLIDPFSYCLTNVINIWTVSGLNLPPLTDHPDGYFVTLLQTAKQMFKIFLFPTGHWRFITNPFWHIVHTQLTVLCYINHGIFKIVVKYTGNQPSPSQMHRILPNSLVHLMFATKFCTSFI